MQHRTYRNTGALRTTGIININHRLDGDIK
jgi:hypothetical protein